MRCMCIATLHWTSAIVLWLRKSEGAQRRDERVAAAGASSSAATRGHQQRRCRADDEAAAAAAAAVMLGAWLVGLGWVRAMEGRKSAKVCMLGRRQEK